MNAPDFTDQDLMAYADGELPEDRAAALDHALADDAGLAERLGLFVDTRAIAAEALRPLLDQPVPDHLVRRVRELAAPEDAAEAETSVGDRPGARVVAFPARSPRRPIWHLPVAASIALAIGLGAGLTLRGNETAAPGQGIAALASLDLFHTLDTLPSGATRPLAGGATVEAVATFTDAGSALCREFEYDHINGSRYVSVACHDGQDWQIRLAIAFAATDAAGYVPAGSLDALDAYLTATGAGAPLDPDAEARALSGLQ